MMATHWIMVIMSVMFLMEAQEFDGTVMMTISLKLVILPKGVFCIETHKHTNKKKKMMSGSTDVLFAFYIKTSHFKKHSSNFFQEFTTISEITHMKKVIVDQYVFRRYFKFIKEINDEI